MVRRSAEEKEEEEGRDESCRSLRVRRTIGEEVRETEDVERNFEEREEVSFNEKEDTLFRIVDV